MRVYCDSSLKSLKTNGFICRCPICRNDAKIAYAEKKSKQKNLKKRARREARQFVFQEISLMSSKDNHNNSSIAQEIDDLINQIDYEYIVISQYGEYLIDQVTLDL